MQGPGVRPLTLIGRPDLPPPHRHRGRATHPHRSLSPEKAAAEMAAIYDSFFEN